MVTFQVSDMTCGHCASAIARAVAGVDKDATIQVSIPQKLVRISGTASAIELAGAVRDAGYTPREIEAEPAPPATPRASGGCCCASRRTASVDAAQAAAAAGSACSGG